MVAGLSENYFLDSPFLKLTPDVSARWAGGEIIAIGRVLWAKLTTQK